MQTLRLPFCGTPDLVHRLQACIGYVLHIHDTWYKCLGVEAVETAATAEGNVVFEQYPVKPEGPEFPFDLLLDLMSGPG